MKGKSTVYYRIWLVLSIMVMCVIVPQSVYATTYIKDAVTAFANELGWVGIAATMIGIVASGIKRSLTGVIGSFLLGGFVSFLLFDPEKINTMAQALFAFLK